MLSDDYFTIQEFSESLEVSPSTIYSYIKAGRIDAEKDNRIYKILRSDKNISLLIDVIRQRSYAPQNAYVPDELLEYNEWHQFLDEFCWLVKICYSPKEIVKTKRFRLDHLFSNYIATHRITLKRLAQVYNSTVLPSDKIITDDLKRGWYNELAYLLPLKNSTLGLSFADIDLNKSVSNSRYTFPSWRITTAYYSIYFYLRSMTVHKFSGFRLEEHGATISCFKNNLASPLEKVIWKFPFDIKYVPNVKVHRNKIYLNSVDCIKYQYSQHPRPPHSAPLEIFEYLYKTFRKRGRNRSKPISYTLFDYLHDFRIWANYLDIDNLLSLWGAGYKSFIDQNLSLILFFIGGISELSYISVFGEKQFIDNLQKLYELFALNNPELENAFENTALVQRLQIYRQMGFVKGKLNIRLKPNINAVNIQ